MMLAANAHTPTPGPSATSPAFGLASPGGASPMPLHSVSTPGQSTQRNEILCVFAIENSARMGPHFETLLMSYIEPIIRYVGQEMKWERRARHVPAAVLVDSFGRGMRWEAGVDLIQPRQFFCFHLLALTHLETAFLKPNRHFRAPPIDPETNQPRPKDAVRRMLVLAR